MIRRLNVVVLTICLLSFSAIVGFSGCAGKLTEGKKTDENALVIPDFPTAKEQFQFAKMYQGNQLIAPELDRRRPQMQKIGECYQRVLKNFPNDPTYVPLTYLELGDCAAQSDEFDLAIQYYQQAQVGTKDEFVLARGQYSVGRIYDTQGRHEEAKNVYKHIIDQYGASQSGKVRDVVTRAAQLYYQVREKGSGN